MMRQGLTIAAGLPKPNLRFILSLSGSIMAVFTWEKVKSVLSMCVSATDGDVVVAQVLGALSRSSGGKSRKLASVCRPKIPLV